MTAPSDWLIALIPHAATHAALLLALGLIILAIGGNYIVPATTKLGNALGIAPAVIAVVVVAGGTSAPELIVSLQAAFANSPDIALGNVLGSNMSNILLVFGLGSLLVRVDLDQPSAIPTSFIMLGFTVITLASLLVFNAITIAAALFLLIASASYITYLLLSGGITKDAQAEETQKPSLLKAVFAVIASIAALLIGADLIVSGGIIFAKQAGMSEAAIGISIIAIGTSLPEIVAVIASLLQRRADVALGNVLGSNIFNLGIILGITALIAPLPRGTDITNITLLSFGLATLLLTGLILSKITFKRRIGVVFVGFYFAFLAVQF